MKVGKFPLYIDQLFFQSAAHRGTRLQASPSQIQEASDLAEFESQTLHATDKSQRLDIVLAVLSETALRSRGSRHQGVALVEPNRINAEADPFPNCADLHWSGSSPNRLHSGVWSRVKRFLGFENWSPRQQMAQAPWSIPWHSSFPSLCNLSCRLLHPRCTSSPHCLAMLLP